MQKGLIQKQQHFGLVSGVKKGFQVFFMRGTETPENLPGTQIQEDLLRFVQQDPQQNSFLVFRPDVLQSQIDQIKSRLPWIKPHYAIKSNPISPILQQVRDNGLGFDCASQNEIASVLAMGVSPKDIVYSNSVKMEKDIYYAASVGVEYTTADSMDEIKKVAQYGKGMKVLWRISIKEKESHNLATIFSNKFGDDLAEGFENVLKEKFQQIKDLGVTLGGIHFHCGSGQNGASNFKEAMEKARECIRIGRRIGHTMELIDIGGGMPANKLTKDIVDALQVSKDDPLGYKTIAEPGRFLSSRTCQLATRVIGKRIKNNRVCYHINDSVYHSFNVLLMDGVSFEQDQNQFYAKWQVGEENKEVTDQLKDMKDGSLFGMTCDGYDIIARQMHMPKMEIGDWLVFSGMGSYTYGPKSHFNGMEATERIYTQHVQQQSPSIQSQLSREYHLNM